MWSTLRGGLFVALIVPGLLAGCGGSNDSASPVTTAPPLTVSLYAPITTTPTKNSVVLTQPWTGTGLQATVGEKIQITASGTLNRQTGSCSGTCVTTPSGSPWATCKDEPLPAFTAPGLACWSLIARIGANGVPFEVGTSVQFTAATVGQLYLGVNDNFYPDDTGAWTVTIVEV